jgi:formylmethanofuran dehydrogenase subunit B
MDRSTGPESDASTMSGAPGTEPPAAENLPAESEARDVTCVACGCLCDDLTVRVRDGRVSDIEGACEAGRDWFLSHGSEEDIPEACVEGRPAGREDALARAGEILDCAKAPVVLGLNHTSTESAAAALRLADRIGAVADSDVGGVGPTNSLAVQRIGLVSATLGEVRNRADLVVFCGGLARNRRHHGGELRAEARPVPHPVAGRIVAIPARCVLGFRGQVRACHPCGAISTSRRSCRGR